MAENIPKRLYTTEIINDLIRQTRTGSEVDMFPFFNQDIELRNANITFKMTEEEYEEYNKCFGDSNYFISNYCKFLTDNGRKLVKLRDYQEDIIESVTSQHYDPDIDEMVPDNPKIILMASRQIGKTTTTAAYMTWYLCFHTDRNIGIMANKMATAKEIVDKVKEFIRNLPFWLKPGCIEFNKHGIHMDNGCRVISSATTKSASIGFTLNGILYLDEFAHIDPNISGPFWRSVYPTLSSSKTAQCIISSTPNGTDNQFFKIWDKSINKENSFKNIRVDYWQVPGHDDKWAEQQKLDFGEEYFNQEFLLQFSSSSMSLLKGSDLNFIHRLCKHPYMKKNIIKSNSILDDPDLVWHKDFDPNYINREDKFTMLIDLSEGNGDESVIDKTDKKSPDSNTIQIFKLVPNSIANMKRYIKDGLKVTDAFRYVQVGRWESNALDEVYCAKLSSAIAFDLFGASDLDNVRIMIEMNFQGKSYLTALQSHDLYNDDVVLKTYHTKPVPGEEKRRKKSGFKTNATKEYFCKKGSKMISKRRTIISDKTTYEQLKSFGKINGKLGGIALHDDLSLPVLNHIPRMLEEEDYIEWLDGILYDMPNDKKKFDINKLLERFDMDNPEISDSEFSSLYTNNEPMYGNNPYQQNSYYGQFNNQSAFGTTYSSLMNGRR